MRVQGVLCRCKATCTLEPVVIGISGGRRPRSLSTVMSLVSLFLKDLSVDTSAAAPHHSIRLDDRLSSMCRVQGSEEEV
jgi:hypothetical protein